MDEIKREGLYGLRTKTEIEVVTRMNLLGLSKKAIEGFINSREIWCTRYSLAGDFEIAPLCDIGGIGLKVADRIEKFEKEYGGTVYHVIFSRTNNGIPVFATFLYVSKWEEEWVEDRAELKDSGYTVAYVMNLADDILSEVGGVFVRPCYGRVIRTS